MADQSIIGVVKKYLNALKQRGIPVDYAVLFGSWADGHPHLWSDIDLLIVSSRFDSERKRDDINLLWRTAARTDSRIEPIPVGQHQYETDDSNPIIEIARRQGQVIAL